MSQPTVSCTKHITEYEYGYEYEYRYGCPRDNKKLFKDLNSFAVLRLFLINENY